MKIKVSDYIADFLADNDINTVFTVVGGGAMHMNDSFGHHKSLSCVYNHHEQASAIAAEAYYRVNNKLAALCVTSGPGAINALNGVVGAYQDSIPMLVFSGQCKSSLTLRKNGLNLRTFGNQEFDIVSALDKVCKYSEMIEEPEKIRYCLEKALYISKSGRPGPCWLDIPVDIQGAYIETDNLSGYIKPETEKKELSLEIGFIIDKIKNSERPVLYAGNGIRISGAHEEFLKLVDILKIPVVTCWNSIDLINTENPYYCGRAGIMGDRAGNFAVQNSDLLISVGSRLSVYQVGYQTENWARESFTVCVDIDPDELKKPTVRIDYPVCCDAGIFINNLIKEISDEKIEVKNNWLIQCRKWKEKYTVVSEKHYEQDEPVNVYAFVDCLSRKLEADSVTVAANGSASVVGSAAYYLKKGSRFIMNCALSSMGYDLPAAVGVCQALEGQKRQIVCIAGDGSIMMNLQELQTIVTNRYPVKIVVINNNGYHQIRITQTNLFNGNFVGIGDESGGLGFPDFSKIAFAFDIPYYKCVRTDQMSNVIVDFLSLPGYAMLEVFCDTKQFFEPKSATRRLENGALYSPPLEDLYPFLSREELKENMYIKMLDE